MKVRRVSRLVSAIAFLAASSVHPVAATDPATDPWTGKTRSDLVTLLGEPSKTKKADGTGSLLIYKLVRLERGLPPPPWMTVLEVPGVGLVGRKVAPGSPGDSGLTFEPAGIDEQGRPLSGGMTETQSSSLSWEDGSRTVTNSWEDRSAVAGKLTLKFRLDPDGRIGSWSVSPKQKKKATAPR